MIAIIDYGMGNLHSVENAFKYIQADCVITNDIEVIRHADKLVLPGVGAFPDCMKHLHEMKLFDVIKEEVEVKKKPLLGICLGMQALFEDSYEMEYTKGFGFLKGSITLMEDPNVKIPHIGWNLLEKKQNSSVFDAMNANPFVYYVHSYRASNYDEQDLIGYSEYGDLTIVGMVQKDNVVGCQFHPEKSGTDGLAILKWFVEVFS